MSSGISQARTRVLDITVAALDLPSEPRRNEKGVWLVTDDGPDGTPKETPIVDQRKSTLLEYARAYDMATDHLETHTSAEYVNRMDQDSYLPQSFKDAAALSVVLQQLDDQYNRALQYQTEVRRHLEKLNDRKSREAVDAERKLATQISLVKESLDKQVKRFDMLKSQCYKGVGQRENEARKAEQQAQDRSTLMEVEKTMDILRDLADQSAMAIRASRLREPDGS